MIFIFKKFDKIYPSGNFTGFDIVKKLKNLFQIKKIVILFTET